MRTCHLQPFIHPQHVWTACPRPLAAVSSAGRNTCIYRPYVRRPVQHRLHGTTRHVSGIGIGVHGSVRRRSVHHRLRDGAHAYRSCVTHALLLNSTTTSPADVPDLLRVASPVPCPSSSMAAPQPAPLKAQ